MPSTDRKGIWVIAVGAWGDLLVQYGYAQTLAKDKGEKINFLIYWPDATDHMVKLLQQQPDLGTIIHVRPPQKEFYLVHTRWWGGRNKLATNDKWLPQVLTSTGIDYNDVCYAPVLTEDSLKTPLFYYNDLLLPPDSVEWAEKTMADIRQKANGKPVILAHPFSLLTNNPINTHWAGWVDGLKWLSDSCCVVLTGAGWATNMQNCVDLLGKTPSVLEVYALAKLSDGIVTTSNSMSIFSLICNKPTVVCCNKIIGLDKNYYYYRLIHHSPNTVLDFNSTLSLFQETCTKSFQLTSH